MIYIFSWAVNYFFLFLPNWLLRKKYGAVMTLFVLGSIVILRGRVGVDVGNVYEPMVAQLDSVQGTEPLFLGLLHILVPFFPTPLLTVTMGIGLVFIGLLFIYIARANENELFILQAFYFPAIFYDQSISGQRFGLAFVILMIMIQCVRLKQFKLAWVLSIVAFFTHYSTAVFLVFWASIVFKTRRALQFVAMFVSVTIFVVVAAFAQAYFLLKYYLYFESGYDRPSLYSGLAIVLATVIMAIGIIGGSLCAREKTRIVAITFLGIAGFWIIGLYSYGALRLLTIIELVAPFAYLALHEQHSLRFQKQFKVMLILAGMLGAGFIYKDMLKENSVNPASNSTSLPYRWFWDVSD